MSAGRSSWDFASLPLYNWVWGALMECSSPRVLAQLQACCLTKIHVKYQCMASICKESCSLTTLRDMLVAFGDRHCMLNWLSTGVSAKTVPSISMSWCWAWLLVSMTGPSLRLSMNCVTGAAARPWCEIWELAFQLEMPLCPSGMSASQPTYLS